MQPNKQTLVALIDKETGRSRLRNWRAVKKHLRRMAAAKDGGTKRFKSLFRKDKADHPVASKFANWL